MSNLYPVTVITGASRGIGLQTALLLSKNNQKVYAFVRSLRNCSELLKWKNENLEIIEIDILDFDKVNLQIIRILDREGKIDNIINNACSIAFGAIEEISIEQMRNQFEVNLFAHINIIQLLLPFMREKNKGKIIFIGSTSGIKSHGMYGIYAASKFALEAVAHALAINVAKWNIHVSIIELSATATDIGKFSVILGNRFSSSENPYRQYTEQNLLYLNDILEKGAHPKDIASCVYFALESITPKFRYFATERAEEEFKDVLKDPENNRLEKEKLNRIQSEL